MRLIPEQRQQDILEATCSLLKKDYPFRLNTENEQGPCGESVRIISGEEEGMWGWVAVNYLMDGFGHMPHSSSSLHDPTLLPLPKLEKEKQGSLETDIPPTLVDPNQHTPTFGFLDMGGASTQIAFSPTFEELKESGYPAEELKSVSLRLLSGQVVEWPVFVASWLGFGTNKARDRYVQLKLDEWKREEENGGLSGSMDPIEDPCLPKGLSLPSSLSQTTPPFIGTGSFSQCLTSLQHLLEKEAPCPEPHGHCLFAGLPTPHIDFEREEQRGFIGISEYWYTAQQVLGLGGVWDWGEWERGMNEFCRKDWTALEGQIRSAGNWHDSQVRPRWHPAEISRQAKVSRHVRLILQDYRCNASRVRGYPTYFMRVLAYPEFSMLAAIRRWLVVILGILTTKQSIERKKRVLSARITSKVWTVSVTPQSAGRWARWLSKPVKELARMGTRRNKLV